MAHTFYEKLSAQDAAFLGFESPTTPMHVSGQSIYELGPDDDFRFPDLADFVADLRASFGDLSNGGIDS